MIFRMLCDRGDVILTERHTYSGAIEAARPLGLILIGVDMDSVGMMPIELDRLVSEWKFSTGLKPRVLYTIPTGHNPTARTQTAERRRDIYKVAEKHDLCIVKDDPYYFLQLSALNFSTEKTTESTIEAYLASLPPSYLSIDTSGRVLRLDSVSKILAPGLRCGWLTGCSELAEKFLQHTEFSTVAPSGPSQVMLYKLLDETWGHEGFMLWLIYLSVEYRRRKDTLRAACARYLDPELCTWPVPTAGMFLWLQVNWTKHPYVCSTFDKDKWEQSIPGIENQIHEQAKMRGVLISKGGWFNSAQRPSKEMFFRLTFAAAREQDLEKGVESFSEGAQSTVSGQILIPIHNRVRTYF